MALSANHISAKAAVPFFMRFTLTVLEPLFAVNGTILTLFGQSAYTSGVTRNGVPYYADAQFLYTQLGSLWLVMAFHEAVVLNLVDDLRVWRLLSAGWLISDVFYHLSAAQAVGGWDKFFTLSEWSSFEVACVVTALAPALMRICIVFGVSLNKSDGGVAASSAKKVK
ncbi:hypothetical protein B0H63DRAFT_557666 [Podospora didyma]|uniref:DUF7704 domain-containing protein n=1 Tax=Podospora didyma TaxID=330526 RepID=A0AAE0U4K9_9PEZI|nr:hypothetical protein B0H63DRAFT_557666 [Podospora didyma]